MTDGRSQGEISAIESRVGGERLPVTIFTVGYGSDADFDVLQRIARLGEGQAYPSDEATIEQLYSQTLAIAEKSGATLELSVVS